MAGTLTRWEPFAELADLRSRFDRMLAEFGDGHEREWMPAIDVMRDNGNLVVRADVPGIKPDEITVQVDDGVLLLSGKHEESKSEKDGDFMRRERRFGSFSRTIALPKGVDPKKVKAVTKDGVLEIKLALPDEATRKPVTIKPTAGS
jgi:HSP20 family protein